MLFSATKVQKTQQPTKEQQPNIIMTNPQHRLVLRITEHSLTFARPNAAASEGLDFETFIPKSGISMAANLREAFANGHMHQERNGRILALVEGAYMPIPIEDFNESTAELIYSHSIDLKIGHTVMHAILPDMHCVVLFQVSKDLQQVLNDNFGDVRILPLMLPLWTHLCRKSNGGIWRKLFVYFHEKHMELFSFDKNRFRFCNQYNGKRTADNIFYILYAWQQMGLDSLHDELLICGNCPNPKETIDKLKQYVQKTSLATASELLTLSENNYEKELPFDLMPLFAG